MKRIVDGVVVNLSQEESDLIQAEWDSDYLSDIIESKSRELEYEYLKATENGFESLALGTPHIYKSHAEAQTDLIGLKACNRDRNVWCSADGGITWGFVTHTSAQIEQVLNDGADIKELAFTNLMAKKTEILTIKNDIVATDIDKIYAIKSVAW